ncbi:type IV secretion system protein [Rhizobium sp. Root1204]|uniref:type IV secretion system protein n=1 Tax=Rhizobium sp. Root1204 TaxID=1736428 RepID=UPI000714D127|nr:type IV secretion system protein [Rhizobium sp. Root1204]KQV35989.1 hypothetical protein ASC96_29195 [Rhizobium sp. Root1204]
MRTRLAIAGVLAVSTPAFADVPVIDNANLTIARKNAENTGKIMNTNTDILEKTKAILGALSGSRDGSMGISSTGLSGNMSVSAAPSFSSIMNGGTLSFGGLDANSQNIAATLINGLQLVKQVKAIVDGEDAGAMNSAFSGAVNTVTLLSALTQQATQGISKREQSLQSATGQIGSSEDVKGSVDANTRMQLETARTINELIGVSNGAVSALNTDMQMRLTQQSETAKMLQYKDINPFK